MNINKIQIWVYLDVLDLGSQHLVLKVQEQGTGEENQDWCSLPGDVQVTLFCYTKNQNNKTSTNHFSVKLRSLLFTI